MDISELLRFALESGGSDLHISAGEPPVIRIHGEMTKVDLPPLDKEDVHNMIYDILSDFQRKVFEEHLELDFSFGLGDLARFRVNVFKQHRGESAVFRTIPSKIPTFEELNLPRVFKDIAGLEKGLVLVTGPTGSGKSTTLAAYTPTCVGKTVEVGTSVRAIKVHPHMRGENSYTDVKCF